MLKTKRKHLYEGKAKALFEGPQAHTLVQYFKDDATAFNNQKKGIIVGKGVVNNSISSHIMMRLTEIGIPTHFLRRLNMREQLIKKADMLPLEVVVRNVAAGSLCKRLGLKEGDNLARAIVEYYYKDDALGDPLVGEDHITAFGWANYQELEEIYALSLRINDFLRGLFSSVNLILVDFKLEYGRNEEGELMLADEISPDSCRLWDSQSSEKMDKDRFRHNLGKEAQAYEEVARRLGVLPAA